jgi:predicted Zn-dependent peptidase
MYEVIKINDFCILLNQVRGSKTCKVEAFIGDGFINETKKTSGIAHLLEHVIADSWKKCYKTGCANFWKKYGVLTTAETELNMVMYYIEGLAVYTDKMINYIISIVTNPNIINKRLKKEKKAITNELLQHSVKYTKLLDKSNKVLFKNEGLSLCEDRKLQLENLELFDIKILKLWVKKNYCRNNTLFVISGDYKRNKVMKQLKKILGGRKINADSCHFPNYCNIFNRGLNVTYLKDADKTNTDIIFSFPNYINSPNKTLIYIRFFEIFIGGGVESLLMEELRDKNDLIYNVSVDSKTFPGASCLWIEISTKNKNIKKVVLNTIEVLKRIINGNFSDETMSDLKETFMVTYYSRCLNNDFYTRFYGSQLMNQLHDLDGMTKIYTYEEIANLIAKLKKNEFIDFIKNILNFRNMKVVYQGTKFIKSLKNDVEKIIN